MIENEENGVFHPQNSEYGNTSEIVKLIAKSHNKKIILISGVTWVLRIFACMTGLVNKAFGNLSYDMSISEYKADYRKYTLAESIRKNEEE